MNLDPPIPIRNLTSLNQDMVGTVRNILHAIWEYERTVSVDGTPPNVERLIEATERNARTLLEFLTGVRE